MKKKTIKAALIFMVFGRKKKIQKQNKRKQIEKGREKYHTKEFCI